MKHREHAAAILSLLVATSASAQTIGSVAVPRLPAGAPTLIIPGAPAMGGNLSIPTLSPSSLTPVLAAPSIAPTPINALVPAALHPLPVQPAAPAALRAATSLSGTLSAAASEGRSQAPALDAAFDGLKAASTPDAVSVPNTPSSDAFVLEARRRFQALRRAESERGSRPEGAIPSDEDMHGRMDRLPSTNPERAKFMIELFKLGGATDADIVLQDAGRGRNNIIVTKKGKTDRVIVVGGHYDQVSEGLGKIDNGTGATMVANLYQALNGTETDATIVFIAFAREEEGLYGSQAYVRSLDKTKRAKIDAMINLDTLAVDGTFTWKNNSTRALLDRFAQVSRDSGHASKEDYLNGGDADSSTFRDAGIPAITIYGASQDVIFDVIHSERDNMSAFSLKHYKNAYMLVLEAIRSLDRTPLGPVGRRDI
ncbi:MAG: M20/M25/M40 family metallo-hydrolase [Elusimicrobia bacterium]|nr:M20/M25/M40 family metallo-hydrolase [Elusimicrobiota bacterium]